MSSSAKRALGLTLASLLASGAAAAQTADRQAAGPPVPPAVAAAVLDGIAREWSADPAGIRLEWGAVPAAAVLGPTTPFRLMGKGTDGWYVAVFEPRLASPVAVRLRAGRVDTITVAARPLGINLVLASEDLRRDVRLAWGNPAADGAQPGEGWVTRRPLAAGDPITAANAMPPQLVKAGDAVQLEWQRGGVMVGLGGIALGSGALGETVRVRLAERGGQRSGRIVGPNAVRLES
jgi:flagella basal body P-ring formation protein FlgA